MAKASGNTRTIRPQSKSISDSRLDYQNALASGRYDISQSYFSEKNGGQLLVYSDRKHDQDEYDAALAMAKDGLIVKLTPEGKIEFSIGIGYKGDPVYADGLVNGSTYEQQTKKPTKIDDESLAKAIDKALKHAYDKRAEIPLIYDKYGSFHREHIEAGLERFERMNKFRFKAILVVDKNKNLWEHQHNQ